MKEITFRLSCNWWLGITSWDQKNRSIPSRKFSSVQFNCLVISDSLWTHELQHAKLPCPSPTPRACSNSCPSSWWWNQPSHPLLSHPAFNLSQHHCVFKWVSFLQYWSLSFSISPFREYSGLIFLRIDLFALLVVQGTLKSLLQHHSSEPSSVLNFLYSPTLTSIHDYRKNHSFD